MALQNNWQTDCGSENGSGLDSDCLSILRGFSFLRVLARKKMVRQFSADTPSHIGQAPLGLSDCRSIAVARRIGTVEPGDAQLAVTGLNCEKSSSAWAGAEPRGSPLDVWLHLTLAWRCLLHACSTSSNGTSGRFCRTGRQEQFASNWRNNLRVARNPREFESRQP
jgi:hypothetical protein